MEELRTHTHTRQRKSLFKLSTLLEFILVSYNRKRNVFVCLYTFTCVLCLGFSPLSLLEHSKRIEHRLLNLPQCNCHQDYTHTQLFAFILVYNVNNPLFIHTLTHQREHEALYLNDFVCYAAAIWLTGQLHEQISRCKIKWSVVCKCKLLTKLGN